MFVLQPRRHIYVAIPHLMRHSSCLPQLKIYCAWAPSDSAAIAYIVNSYNMAKGTSPPSVPSSKQPPTAMVWPVSSLFPYDQTKQATKMPTCTGKEPGVLSSAGLVTVKVCVFRCQSVETHVD